MIFEPHSQENDTGRDGLAVSPKYQFLTSFETQGIFFDKMEMRPGNQL